MFFFIIEKKFNELTKFFDRLLDGINQPESELLSCKKNHFFIQKVMCFDIFLNFIIYDKILRIYTMKSLIFGAQLI